jgi:uncharacterized cupin superfamily protein
MNKVCIDAVENRSGPAAVKRPLTEASGATDVALNYYELAPGDSFAYGYHSHESQEELFIVQEGRVTFDTEAGDVVVEAGELIRFAPGEYQQGHNRSDERAVALALGAPQDAGETDIRRECPTCEEQTSQTINIEEESAARVTQCVECGSETGRFE